MIGNHIADALAFVLLGMALMLAILFAAASVRLWIDKQKQKAVDQYKAGTWKDTP